MHTHTHTHLLETPRLTCKGKHHSLFPWMMSCHVTSCQQLAQPASNEYSFLVPFNGYDFILLHDFLPEFTGRNARNGSLLNAELALWHTAAAQFSHQAPDIVALKARGPIPLSLVSPIQHISVIPSAYARNAPKLKTFAGSECHTHTHTQRSVLTHT